MTWIHTEHLWQWNNSFSAEVLEAAMPALVSWDSSISQRTIVLFVFYITDVNNLMMWIGESVSLWHGPMPARFPVAGSLFSRSKEIRVDFKSIYIRTFELCLYSWMQKVCCIWENLAFKSNIPLRCTKCRISMASDSRGLGWLEFDRSVRTSFCFLQIVLNLFVNGSCYY